MPTSVPGISDSGALMTSLRFGPLPRLRGRTRARGFTLIELMVVVVIVGIAAAAISIRVFPDRGQSLRKDAERLAQLFSIAQGEVRADGRQITWQADDAGYRFVRRSRVLATGASTPTALSANSIDTFGRDELLRPRPWTDAPVRVDVTPAGAPVFTAEWIPGPLTVRLQSLDTVVTIQRDEAGRYAVQ